MFQFLCGQIPWSRSPRVLPLRRPLEEALSAAQPPVQRGGGGGARGIGLRPGVSLRGGEGRKPGWLQTAALQASTFACHLLLALRRLSPVQHIGMGRRWHQEMRSQSSVNAAVVTGPGHWARQQLQQHATNNTCNMRCLCTERYQVAVTKHCRTAAPPPVACGSSWTLQLDRTAQHNDIKT